VGCVEGVEQPVGFETESDDETFKEGILLVQFTVSYSFSSW